MRPQWNVYTLTRENECGYINSKFQKLPWNEKRKDMIKLFAMVEICLASYIHFGDEQACVNNYIKSLKKAMKVIIQFGKDNSTSDFYV